MAKKAKTAASMAKPVKLLKVALVVLVVVSVAYLSGALVNKVINDRQAKTAAEFENTVKQSNMLVSERKFDDAIKLWQIYLSQPPPEHYRFDATIYLTTVYQNAGNNQQALLSYQEAEKLAVTDEQRYVSIYGVAQTADALMDKQTAIEYYKKAIELRPQFPDLNVEEDVNRMKARISVLEGQ